MSVYKLKECYLCGGKYREPKYSPQPKDSPIKLLIVNLIQFVLRKTTLNTSLPNFQTKRCLKKNPIKKKNRKTFN